MSKQKDKAPAPKPRTKKGERKRCRTPRGQKLAKVRNQLLDQIDDSFKRHRNDYNQHMARVKKLAKLL